MTKPAVKQKADPEALFEDRWTSFGKHSGILKISRRLPAAELKAFRIFECYDNDFLEKISPDVSVAVWDRGKILYEEGAYIDLAFFVAKGKVNVCVGKQQGRAENTADRRNGAKASLSRGRRNGRTSNLPATVFQTQIQQLSQKRNLTFLSSMDIDLTWGEVVVLGEGEMLGETGSSVGWPQSVTAQTATQCVLVQIRLPALQAMKRKSSDLKQHLDQVYIKRALAAQLQSTPLFRNCSETFIENFKKHIGLVSFRRNQVIAREGDRAEAVFLVRSGFVKLSQCVAAGEMVVNYLSKGMTFGEAEFFVNQETWFYSAVSVESTELLKISYEDFKVLVARHPEIEREVWDSSVARLKESGSTRRDINRAQFLSHALNYGLVQGSSVLAIDLSTCTRCDDCVRGCAETHDGLPRFVREGEKYDDYLVTRACFHCKDPVCLIGCPTGAIRRAGVGEVVEIDAGLCIGCKACYIKCPYDAITMVDSEVWGGHAEPALPGPNVSEFATKCDLCYAKNHEPACTYNCPHGSAVRLEGLDDFSKIVAKRTARRKVRQSKAKVRLMTGAPWRTGFLLALVMLAALYVLNMTFSEVNAGSIWGLFYGSAAAFLMLAVALYGIRRRWVREACNKGLGSARSWFQGHLYGGGLFIVLVFMHTGFNLPDGAFYQWLYAVSLWVTISGLLGVLAQRWLPRLLASGLSLEVAYERITELNIEIREKAQALVLGCSRPVRDFYQKNIAGQMRSPAVSLIYYFDITGGIHKQTKQFSYLRALLSAEEQVTLDELQMLFKSKLELDAHYTIQKTLRWWLYLHLPVSLLLLGLVCLHMFAVFYY